MEIRPRLVQVDRRPEQVRAPGEPLPGIERLTVVRNDRLGDLILSLPAISALRRAYPRAGLSLVVRPEFLALARTFACADAVVEAPADVAGLRSLFEGARADLAVCISRDAAVARAVALARVPNRVGTGYRLYSPLFTRTVRERRRHGGRHEVEYALSFAHRAGARADRAEFPIDVRLDSDAAVGDWLRSRNIVGSFVVLHPGSGGSCPGWPLGHYAVLTCQLEADGVRTVISVGPADSTVASYLDRAGRGPAAPPRFSGGLPELAALLRRADLVISNSTGPLHLAAALGTPTLGLFAPWPSCSATRWGPYAPNGWAIEAGSREAAGWSRARRARSGQELMAGISPRIVLGCARDLARGRFPSIRTERATEG